MTIEEIKSEKALLQEKIENALDEFHAATKLTASGEFRMVEKFVKDEMGFTIVRDMTPMVTINPIEI